MYTLEVAIIGADQKESCPWGRECVIYGYKPLSKRDAQARGTAVQTNKISPIKHENQRNDLSCLIEYFLAPKFYRTRSNNTKQSGQTIKSLVIEHCVLVFTHQTFPVWIDLSID